jgi:hypothetical protein
VAAGDYLSRFGISLVDITERTSVNLVPKQKLATVLPDTDKAHPNIIVQAGSYGECAYTLAFAAPQVEVVLSRPALSDNNYGDWSAHALSEDGRELGVIGEQARDGVATAATFTLRDPSGHGIYKLRIESNHQRYGTLNSVVLDGLTLTPR